MVTKLRRALVAIAAATLLTLPASAQTGPFFDNMTLQSHAYGLEMVAMRLALIEAYGDPVPGDLEEQIEKVFSRDVRRFAGTLEALDAELAANLWEALEEAVEDAEDGRANIAAIATARELWERAYALLVPAETRSSPAFVGAVMADLLLADDGVAEALEDALDDELWEYPGGWAALQRVKALWASVMVPLAGAEQVSFGEQYVAFMEEIYPSHVIPERLPDNPEEAEAPAQSMVGVLETITGVSLYTGRDLPYLAGHLAELVAPACDVYAAGNDRLAVESIYAARNHYRKHLRRLLDLVAPDIHVVAGGMLDALISSDPPEDRAAACGELRDALQEAKSALGG